LSQAFLKEDMIMTQVPVPGIELIKTFEGCRLVAYPDPHTGAEPITIGWGSTRDLQNRPFRLGDRITQQQADELLINQLTRVYLPPQVNIPGWDTAILILAKSYSTARNRGMVMPSERAKRARAVERAGFI
jgi:GH24 family phage-related lysozyme (muramidase)